MKISVVLCTYNGEKYIEEQLKSICSQIISVDELIISDDFSQDNTLLIAEQFLCQQSISYRIVKNSNRGVCNNFLNALKLTKGDIIFFSDQDDIWMSNKTEVIMSYFQKDDHVSLVCTNAVLIDNDKNVLGDLYSSIGFNQTQDQDDIFHRVLKKPFVTGATMAIRRELYEKALPFSKHMLHDQWLSYIAACDNGIYISSEKLIYYRQHGENLVGVDKGICERFVKLKRRISCGKVDNYGERLLFGYLDLKQYLIAHNADRNYQTLVDDFIEFWKIRTEFKTMSLFDVRQVIKKSKKDYCKYSTTMNPAYEYLKYFLLKFMK